MQKKSGIKFIRIAVTAALLTYVFHKSGLLTIEGWQNLFGSFVRANKFYIFISLIFVPLVDFVSTVKWYCLARACQLKVGLWRLYAYYMVGRFFNMVLPSSVGGDVIRVHELGRYTGRYTDSAAVVFVERFSGLVVLVFLTIIAVIVNLQIFNMPWLSAMLALGLVGVVFICWVIVDDWPYNFINKHFGNTVPIVSAFLEKLGKFREAVLIFKEKPGALWLAVFNSLVFYLLAIFNVWFSALAFDDSIQFVSMLVAVPVIMFIMNLPFSIGGIGLMEFAYSVTLGLFGINPTVAISTTLLMRLKTLMAAGIGSLVYPLVSESVGTPDQISKSINAESTSHPSLNRPRENNEHD